MSFQSSNPILARNSAAIPKELRPLHQANTKRLFTSFQEARELETGYALRLADEVDLLPTVIEFPLFVWSHAPKNPPENA